MKKIILAVLAIIALFAVVGSASAYDNGNISLIRCLFQCAIGVAVEWFALKNLNA